MMKSYMVIDRNEADSNGNIIAVCEVENISMNDSKRKDNPEFVEFFMTDVPERLFRIKNLVPVEQEIYSVFHDGKNVYEVFDLSSEERENW